MKPHHRVLLALGALAVLGAALWFALRRDGAGVAAQPALAKAPAVGRAPGDLAAVPEAPPASLREVADELELAAAPAPEQPAPELDPAPVPDLEARAWTVFRVTNERGFPVPGAEIVLTGLRTEREPSSHYAWRTEPSLGKTAADGTLRLAYPVWVDLDGATGQVSFTVAHPDYATYESHGTAVAPEIEVVLELGSVLVVSGWIDDPDGVITDVRAHFSWDVDVDSEDWLPRRDGRLTTTRVPPGNHVVFLAHTSAELGPCASAMTEFALEAGETLELHLELKPTRPLIGRLDEVVPRPVVDGIVVLALQAGTSDRSGAVLRTIQAAVEPDGSFDFGRVMDADAQVVALCRGWASRPTRELAPDTAADPASGQALTEGVAQAFDLAGDDRELVVAMEPAAALELELRLPDGGPAEGVEVSVWPNACWSIGACGLFVDGRSWTATTDGEGRARVEDLPAGRYWFGVSHAALDLPLDPPDDPGADRSRSLPFEPGKTTSASYTLERTGPR